MSIRNSVYFIDERMIRVYLNLWDAEYREHVGFQAEFNWDMGVCSRHVLRKTVEGSPDVHEKREKRTCSRQRHPAVARGSLISFFSAPEDSWQFRSGQSEGSDVCDRRVSDDPDVGRTDAHDERRIIWVSLCGCASRFNHRSLWAAG